MPHRLLRKMREFVCVNQECPLEGKIQLFEEGKAEYWCESCHQTLHIIPEVTPDGVFINVREANALRHFLMTQFIPQNKYALVVQFVRKLDERLTNLGHPYDISIVDPEGIRYDAAGRPIKE